jgi:hypothetical protein
MTVSACVRLTCRTSFVFMLCLLAGVQPGSAADLSAKILFDIPPQQLASALLKYSAQSGVQVTSSADAVEDRVSAGIVGKFVAREALDKLLAGSTLTYEVVDAHTVAIRAPVTTEPDVAKSQLRRASTALIRLAE